MKDIIFTKSFKKYFDNIDDSIQKIIIIKINLLSDNDNFLDTKKLKPKHL